MGYHSCSAICTHMYTYMQGEGGEVQTRSPARCLPNLLIIQAHVCAQAHAHTHFQHILILQGTALLRLPAYGKGEL